MAAPSPEFANGLAVTGGPASIMGLLGLVVADASGVLGGPPTGTDGQVLALDSTQPLRVRWVAQPTAVGVPAGGTAGQALVKVDATDYNTRWADVAGGTGGGATLVGSNNQYLYYSNGVGTGAANLQVVTDGIWVEHNVTLNIPNGSATVATTGTELIFQQTGDLFGPCSMTLRNRTGAGGVLFSGANDLFDMGFVGNISGNQSNVRFECRVGALTDTRNTSGEFQFFDAATTANYGVPLSIGRNSIVVGGYRTTAKFGVNVYQPSAMVDINPFTIYDFGLNIHAQSGQFAPPMRFLRQSASNTEHEVGGFNCGYSDDADATFKGYVSLWVSTYNAMWAEGLRIGHNGTNMVVSISGVPYVFPAATAAGSLTNDGAGNLTWAAAAAATPFGGTLTGTTPEFRLDNGGGLISRWNRTTAGGMNLKNVINTVGVGYSGSFNGSSSFGQVAAATALRPTAALTITGWINGSAFATNAKVICLNYGTGAAAPYVSYTVQLANTNNLQFAWGNALGIQTCTSSTPLVAGTWYFFHAAFGSATGARMRVYQAGAISDTSTSGATGDIIYSVVNPLCVGVTNPTSTELWNGLLKDIRIFNSKLSDADADAMAGGAEPSAGALALQVAHWPFNDATGATAADTQSGNNLALTNVAWSSVIPPQNPGAPSGGTVEVPVAVSKDSSIGGDEGSQTFGHTNGLTKIAGKYIGKIGPVIEHCGAAPAFREFRAVARFSAGAATTGAFLITTPFTTAAPCMGIIRARGFLNDATGPFDVTVGFNQLSDGTFQNAGYVNAGSQRWSVQLARSAGAVVLILGSTGTTYQYCQMTVEAIQAYSGITERAALGWTITQVTSTAAYTNITAVNDVTYIVLSAVKGAVAGAVPFANASGVLTSDANFQVTGAGTTLALGVGGAPSANARLHVKGKPFIQDIDVMTYATPLSVDVTKPNVHRTTTTSGVGNSTFNASSGGVAGQEMTFIITNDATAARTITFGTNFKPSATLAGTISKTATIAFVSDGTSWYETRRATGL